LGRIWDAVAHGACSNGSDTANALHFTRLGIKREIEELQGLLGLSEAGEGGADANNIRVIARSG
jgi:hypothetical protein